MQLLDQIYINIQINIQINTAQIYIIFVLAYFIVGKTLSEVFKNYKQFTSIITNPSSPTTIAITPQEDDQNHPLLQQCPDLRNKHDQHNSRQTHRLES